ncbi:MAG: DUF4007 family protein [Leptotrichiaceae bacterium]|nr:DUF4007 family protein [Leptotrichiaceae bacterium]
MELLIVGHSSFYLRNRWIKKGIEYIGKYPNENAFSKSNLEAVDELGIGSVMVQSLRFWLNFLDIMKKEDKKFFPKRGIEQILEEDPYLQNNNALWLIHTYIMERDNKKEIPLIWNTFISNVSISVFDENSAENLIKLKLKEISKNSNLKISDRSLKDSIIVFIKTYYKEKNLNVDPEDNLSSPFVKLDYLQKNQENQYYFRNISSTEISEYIALYLIMRKFQKNEINLKEAYEHFNKIIKMRFSDYEKMVIRLENRNILSVDRAAGLQNIIIKKVLTENEIIERILESENK